MMKIKHKLKPWSKDETQKLIRGRQGEYTDPWSTLAKSLNRTVEQCKAKDEVTLLKKSLDCGPLHNDFLDTNQETRSQKSDQAIQ
jgi:hypothetical protein